MNPKKPFDADGWQSPSLSIPSRPIQVTAEDELEFQIAMESYKQRSGRNFPTWSEILELLRSLGYAKRIWKPVQTWSRIATNPVASDVAGDESPSVIGWFSRVETPAGS